jgi:hypothetical protein
MAKSDQKTSNLSRKTPKDEQKVDLKAISDAISGCFGRPPVACDGFLMVKVEDYNLLAAVVNKQLKRAKQ